MSKFTSPCKIESLTDVNGIPLLDRDGRPLYIVLEDLVYESDLKGVILIVPKGFITNLASIPQIAMSIFGDLPPAPFVLHDWLYSTAKYSRFMCDRFLKEACYSSNIIAWKITLIYMGVRVGGESHYGIK